MFRVTRLCLLISLFCVSAFSEDLETPSEFPIPETLKANVAFWKHVYSDWTTEQIAFSDEEDLSMVYTVIDVPKDAGTLSRKLRAEKIQRTKAEIRSALLELNTLRPESEDEVSGFTREIFIALKDVKRDDKYRPDSIRAQNGLKDSFQKGYRLAGAHEKEIRARLKQARLPEDLIALAFVESLFYPKAKSHAGAGGIWQFLKATAREYMRVNKLVDERYDPILATDAAIKYIQTAKAQLVEWPLVITSYNYGRGGMMRAVETVGSRDFDTILKSYDHDRFGFAARNYYAEFLAALDIYREAKQKFPSDTQEAPWNYDVITLDEATFLRDLTRHDRGLSEALASLNPALTPEVIKGREVLPPGFNLRVPKGERGIVAAKISSNPKEEKRRAAQMVRARHRANGRQTLAQIAGMYDVDDDQLSERLGIDPTRRPRRGTIVNIRSSESKFTPLPEPVFSVKRDSEGS